MASLHCSAPRMMRGTRDELVQSHDVIGATALRLGRSGDQAEQWRRHERRDDDHEDHGAELRAREHARGLEVVSDDGALIAAVDEALAGQPDVAEKIRGGNLGAVGAIIGAVMKSTRGQADAGRVRELVMERVEQD